MTTGKPLCVFVHGWGMNRTIWQPVIDALPNSIEAIALDLPGHGQNTDKCFTSLDDLVVALRRDITRPAIWIGWSLGGLAVLKLALEFPQLVQAMLLVASTPCFVHKAGWSYGMPAALFTGFAADLEADFENTVKRFLTLQVKDSAQGRQILKQLRSRVLQQPAANIQALRSGLEILQTTDMHQQLMQLNMPVAVALGERDTLVNVNCAQNYLTTLPQADVRIYSHAAHAPFLSHLPDFSMQLLQLVNTVHNAKT